jgi:hypothetical protein
MIDDLSIGVIIDDRYIGSTSMHRSMDRCIDPMIQLANVPMGKSIHKSSIIDQ